MATRKKQAKKAPARKRAKAPATKVAKHYAIILTPPLGMRDIVKQELLRPVLLQRANQDDRQDDRDAAIARARDVLKNCPPGTRSVVVEQATATSTDGTPIAGAIAVKGDKVRTAPAELPKEAPLRPLSSRRLERPKKAKPATKP